MAKACEECTQNCLLMHKKNKDPAPVVTTFFKVMMGEDYSKLLLLPPVFARRVKKLVDKTTHLEDFNGEKWNVRFTKNGNSLAFVEGWNTFALDHGLQQGDLLVFHYIMKSHFVVLMYGSTGCPENRHFGFPHHPVKQTKKNNNNLTANHQSPSEVLTNCNNLSHESNSKSEPCANGVNGIKASNKKLNETKMSQSEKATNTRHLVAASSSRPLDEETDQRPELLVKNTDKETDQISQPLVKKTDKETDPTPDPLVKNKEKQTDQRSELLVKNTIPDYMLSKSPTTERPFCLVDNSNVDEPDEFIRKSLQPVESGGYHKNNVAETRVQMSTEKRKESTVRQSEVPHDNPMHKRLRHADVLSTPEKNVKREPDTLVSRLHNSANRVEPIKKEPTMNHGSGGVPKKEPAINPGSSGPIKLEPKLEPVDYGDALPSGSSSTSFSAVMRNYEYLELPDWVKLKKSRVILLRNGNDLWAVLFQTKYKLNALTQNWGTFAKEKGIKPGDTCEFVLESEPNSIFTCYVFNVHITH